MQSMLSKLAADMGAGGLPPSAGKVAPADGHDFKGKPDYPAPGKPLHRLTFKDRKTVPDKEVKITKEGSVNDVFVRGLIDGLEKGAAIDMKRLFPRGARHEAAHKGALDKVAPMRSDLAKLKSQLEAFKAARRSQGGVWQKITKEGAFLGGLIDGLAKQAEESGVDVSVRKARWSPEALAGLLGGVVGLKQYGLLGAAGGVAAGTLAGRGARHLHEMLVHKGYLPKKREEKDSPLLHAHYRVKRNGKK